MALDHFEAVIGLEAHAQISTKSKLFCSCSTDVFEAEPNLHVCPICMGFPGQLPVLNEEALRKGIRVALALNCEIPSFSKFDRKNYFYPDLPKGFQISQYDQPVSRSGWLEIDVEGQVKRVRINRLHIEDDAGKLTHIAGGTLCDYNRTGIPLMEIVTEPDFRNAKEAVSYAKMLQTILRYVGSSEADMEKGMMRFDASVSIRPKGDTKLYSRAEIKNLNSFKSLEAAIDYEIERQVFLWEENNPPKVDVTVGWDDPHQKTYILREKESSADYRYFPEPDLPPMTVTPEFLEELRKEIPELPHVKKARYIDEYKLSEQDAELFSSDIALAQFFEKAVSLSNDPKKAVSFIGTVLIGRLNKEGKGIHKSPVSAEHVAELIKLVNDGVISMNLAKGEVFDAMYRDKKSPSAITEEKGLKQVSDTSAIESVCKKVLEANPKIAADFKSGNEKALAALIGPVMKETRGQANPKVVNDVLKKLLAG